VDAGTVIRVMRENDDGPTRDTPWRNSKASMPFQVTEVYLASTMKCAVACGLQVEAESG
jgi:hypothetical protein